MNGILVAKFTTFIRKPWMFLLFTTMSIIFALILGTSGGMTSISVPVYGSSNIQESFIGKSLEKNDVYTFNWMTEKEMLDLIADGKSEVGVIVKEDDFQLVVGVESTNAQMVEQTIHDIYAKKLQQEKLFEEVEAQTDSEKQLLDEEYKTAMDSPVFTMKTSNFSSSEAFVYDNETHFLFGFTLFFVIYTIAYNVLPILLEKKEGIWDRMILSPVRKTEMYIANLVYSFFEGYLQVLIIFLVFHFWIGVDFQGRFLEAVLLLIPYVFAVVSLSIFITACVKNAQQFNAVLPIVAVSMAMIGGAYWPIEIVESEVLLALSKINPLTYGMEALNGMVVYGYPLEEVLLPISILVLMGVVLMGLGIHLMERRHV
ncbi:ABC transporter permease [Oceanobacillus halophilus]|uniref:ABC transporter permease n=1 Tax=Oceanobacillus halophilus TaxID=930130 RepID=A0A495A362_9BACI|nr:ABC transporter permease [Oceanobacillus halophilus]RKQ33859.1 ABC transporter permease [Oceanobacillus halophilus]